MRRALQQFTSRELFNAESQGQEENSIIVEKRVEGKLICTIRGAN